MTPMSDAPAASSRSLAGHRRDAGDRRLRAAVRRAPPATSSSPRARSRPALERLRDRRRVPLRRVASSASPGWCSPSAPTCSGTRSATPPATSCCSSSSPPRCAARAPTRCPTSPRPGSSRGRCARVASAARGRDRLALPGAAVPGRRPDPAARSPARRPGSAALVVARRRARQRGRRRHAQHHLRAGLPVLAQAHRAARARSSSCCWSGTATARLARRDVDRGGDGPLAAAARPAARTRSTRRTR